MNYRSRTSLALAAALTVLLAGCSDPATSTTAAEPTATTSPAPSPANPLEEAAESPSEAPTPTPGTPLLEYDKDGNPLYCKDQAPATGPAAKEFGKDKVMAAYCQMVTLTMDNAYQPNMLRPAEDRKPIEFSAFEPYMTTSMREDWRHAVKKLLASDKTNDKWTFQVASLLFSSVTNPDMVFPENESAPIVYNKRFGAAKTEVFRESDGNRLGLIFDIDADLAMVDKKSGDTYHLPLGKTVTFYLKPGLRDEQPWLIDGAHATYRVGDRFNPVERYGS